MLKILIVDDHKLMREGLAELIRHEDGMSVVGEAESGIMAVRLACELKPDIVLMDIEMPDLNGIEAARQIRKEAPEVKIIALSMHEDRRFVRQMFGAGARGYVLKGSAFEELAIAIRTVASGHIYANLNLSDMLLTDYIKELSDTTKPMASLLTAREREVLQLLAEGNGNKEIAVKLNVSVTTIDSHRKHITDKLGLHSIAELTRYAIHEGMVSAE